MKRHLPLFIVTAIICLQFLFLILKAFKIVDWNWLIVLSPILAPYAMLLVISIVMGVYFLLTLLIERIKKWTT